MDISVRVLKLLGALWENKLLYFTFEMFKMAPAHYHFNTIILYMSQQTFPLYAQMKKLKLNQMQVFLDIIVERHGTNNFCWTPRIGQFFATSAL